MRRMPSGCESYDRLLHPMIYTASQSRVLRSIWTVPHRVQCVKSTVPKIALLLKDIAAKEIVTESDVRGERTIEYHVLTAHPLSVYCLTDRKLEMSMKLMKLYSLVALLLIAHSATAQDKAKPAAEDSAIEVKLVEPGKGPQKAIRIQPKKGDKQTAVMSMSVNQSMVIRGQKVPIPPHPRCSSRLTLALPT